MSQPSPSTNPHHHPGHPGGASLPRGTRLEGGLLWIIDPIDSGGMGQVYLAWHEVLNTDVAVKVANDPAMEARFRREIELQHRLGGHPHIVGVRTAGRHDGRPYLVMEYVPGMNLERYVRANGPLPYREACAYIRQAALGLGHAHDRGLVHRDIKPSNLLRGEEGPTVTIKVADWGLARRTDQSPSDEGGSMTRPGTLLGTPDYISPEQILDPSAAGPASDLYSLGCTFHYFLTGRPPFGAHHDKLAAHLKARVPNLPDALGIPSGVEAILIRLLDKRAEGRYRSAQDLVEALDRSIECPSPSPPPRRDRRRVSLASVAVLAAVALAVFLHYRTRSIPAPHPSSTVTANVKNQGKSIPVPTPPPPGLPHYEIGKPQAVTELEDLGTVPFPAPKIENTLVFRDFHSAVALPPPLTGQIDVVVYRPDQDNKRRPVVLSPEILPLKPGKGDRSDGGDGVRIKVTVDRPAHLYVIWIDSQGDPQPIYPWKPNRWDVLDTPDQRLTRLDLGPTSDANGEPAAWPVDGPAGMETLILLARDSPLPADLDLRKLLPKSLRQTLRDKRSLVWFADWQEAIPSERGIASDYSLPIDDPLYQMVKSLQNCVGPYFTMMRGVSFEKGL